jgi:hypothetical protein
MLKLKRSPGQIIYRPESGAPKGFERRLAQHLDASYIVKKKGFQNSIQAAFEELGD